jgi:hypothetical protein
MLHRSLAALLCLLGLSAAAPADALTLLVEGVIDFVDDPLGIGSPGEGAAFSVLIAFPTGVSAPPEPGGIPGSLSAHNLLAAPPGQYGASVGPWTLSPGSTPGFPDPRVEVSLFWNTGSLSGAAPADAIGIRTFSQQIAGSGLDFVAHGGNVTSTVYLEGPHGTLSPSLLLSDIPLDPSVWSTGVFDLEYYLDADDNHDASYASGTVTSITVLTPEPTTALLLGAGLAALGCAPWWSRARSFADPTRSRPRSRPALPSA